eukprot:TRINITY_DN11694_c2_g1_i1.p1 TRINITY_DN11694_c2_g1~~TRINITY_DN11694_c2_g1_i1.p1  ORF type:complete len:585 (+),score=88.16 TRINITY_DN11694_c2_g1_i1:102-1856(+)
MKAFASRADMSWMRELRPDPESSQYAPNRSSRQVKSGHWVPVKPTPLTRPRLVIYSPVMAEELGLSEADCKSEEFLRFFSGDIDAVPGFDSWATPYALAIMGQEHYNNCPFKNGNGYGDGRAVSVGEVIAPSGQRWEMQLKGGGQTPFCRGADGRAVLRSSVREFLASEAMHHLGISTTRAISLIVSQDMTIKRPWYSGESDNTPSPDDPRLAQIPEAMRPMFMQMMQQQRGEPDVMIDESCAITCRVAPSFTRIGHLDLFARRVRKSGTPEQVEEHRMIVEHAFKREYSDVCPDAKLPERALAVFKVATERIATMVAGWLRVGYCQGNFNCDNCLVGGRTMDYGPFGFIDKYDPDFAKWVGSGDHFAFQNQPGAAYANLSTLAGALKPLLDDSGKKQMNALLSEAKRTIKGIVEAMWCSKLGFKERSEAGGKLWHSLDTLMQKTDVDYTVLFRQLSMAPTTVTTADEDAKIFDILAPAFYKSSCAGVKAEWAGWVRNWLSQLSADGLLDGASERMKQVNPKYILREYILVAAYEAAKRGDYSIVHELYGLIRQPYDEHPALEGKYYKRAPDVALTKSGTAVMT